MRETHMVADATQRQNIPATYSRFQRMSIPLRFFLRSFLARFFYVSPLLDMLENSWHRLLGQSVVRLEVSSTCQLACPICPTGTGKTKSQAVGWGHLSLRNFAAFVDGNPAIKRIELSNAGEIFLNPCLKDIVEYASKKGIALHANTGVNLNVLSDEMAETLVRCGFRGLVVSIDGASNDVYAKYRINGNFGRVLENVRKINRYKHVYRSRYPKLTWKFIVFGHNEHEIPLARQMAKELGMKFYPDLNCSATHSPVKDMEFVEREAGLRAKNQIDCYHKIGFKFGPFSSFCHQLWTSPQINWDGKLLGCCENRTVSFGNVFEKGLKASLKGERYTLMKKVVRGKAPMRDDLPCSTCMYFPFKEGNGGKPLSDNVLSAEPVRTTVLSDQP